MATTPTVKSLIREELKHLPEDDEDTAVEAEVTEETGEEDGAGSNAPQDEQDVEATTEADSSEALAEGTEEPPLEWYGADLSGLPAEERAKLIAEFQERDNFIQRLLREKAEGGEPEADAKDESSDEGVSDKDILDALGLDPDSDVFAEHTAKVAVPLAKMVLSLQEAVQGLSNKAELDATERYWETSLTALEKQYGTLGVSHEEVMRESAAAGIAEPMDAYWRIMGPVAKEVSLEVQKRRAEVEKRLKQGAAGTTRPSSQADTSEAVVDAKDVKSAVAIAFKQLQTERGL